MSDKVIRQPIITILGHVDSGKCIGGDAIINPLNISLRDLYENHSPYFPIISFNPYTQGYYIIYTDYIERQYVDKYVRIRFEDDSSIDTTCEHSFLVYRGRGVFHYVKSIDLNEGDYVVSISGYTPDDLPTTYVKRVKNISRYYEHIDVYDISSPLKNFAVEDVIVHNTTLLDKIRGTAVQLREAGGITQHIGASMFPRETIEEICRPLLNKFNFKVTVPGLLVIDTPGHEVFSNLRRRGGSASDIAILVVDIMKGFEPQTHESIQILIDRKVPFLVAANKVDLIHGWKPQNTLSILDSLTRQDSDTLILLEEKIAYIISALNTYKFDADRFDRVKDFRKTVAIVPVSAKTGEGIQELLTILIGLVQRFMLDKLEVDLSKPGYGVVLEVSSEHGLGKVLKTIHIDGVVRVGDYLVIGGSEGAMVRRIRSILMPAPLDEIRDPRKKFRSVKASYPAAGIIITAPDLDKAYSGSPFYSISDESSVSKYAKNVEQELASIKIESDKIGVVIKADALGSLEAFIMQCKRYGIPIRKADVGPVSKKDVVEAEIVKEFDDLKGVILAFNVDIYEDAYELARNKKIPIFKGNILYRILEEYLAWINEVFTRRRNEEYEKLVKPGKFMILEGYIFRRSKPAIFGIRVLGGLIKQKYKVMNSDGESIGTIHQIQSMGKNIPEASKDMEVAISIREAVVGRDIDEGDILYVDIPEDDARKLLKEFYGELSEDMREVLKEIIEIKRRKNPLWARG